MNSKSLLLLLAIFLLPGCRLVTLNNSVHFDNNDHNQNHQGIGAEFEVSTGLWVGVIGYDNSFDRPSHLINVTKEWEFSKDWYTGIKGGIADGYDDYMVIAGGIIRYKWVQLYYTPVLIASGLVWEFK